MKLKEGKCHLFQISHKFKNKKLKNLDSDWLFKNLEYPIREIP